MTETSPSTELAEIGATVRSDPGVFWRDDGVVQRHRAPLPTPDETEIESARRRRIAGELRMSGVASTLLGGGAGGKLG